jgi:hypothetical protein
MEEILWAWPLLIVLVGGEFKGEKGKGAQKKWWGVPHWGTYSRSHSQVEERRCTDKGLFAPLHKYGEKSENKMLSY